VPILKPGAHTDEILREIGIGVYDDESAIPPMTTSHGEKRPPGKLGRIISKL